MADIRKIVGDSLWFLVPGVGKQGGDLAASVKAAKDSRGRGFLISNSRAIIFASSGPDFAEAAKLATIDMHNGIHLALTT